jgi:hypothetical protein
MRQRLEGEGGWVVVVSSTIAVFHLAKVLGSTSVGGTEEGLLLDGWLSAPRMLLLRALHSSAAHDGRLFRGADSKKSRTGLVYGCHVGGCAAVLCNSSDSGSCSNTDISIAVRAAALLCAVKAGTQWLM